MSNGCACCGHAYRRLGIGNRLVDALNVGLPTKLVSWCASCYPIRSTFAVVVAVCIKITAEYEV